MVKNPYSSVTFDKQEEVIENLKALSYSKKISPPYSDTPFGEIFEVWAGFAEKELRKRVKDQILSPKANKKLKGRLIQSLSFCAAPTLAALMRIVKNDNQLQGVTPKERYLYFIEEIFPDPEYLNEIFKHFQPLKQAIATYILLWIDQAEEFLKRLHQDFKEIESEFSNSPLGKVADLNTSLSDLHNGNRSVYKLVFENGLNLIYKPKDLNLDQAFNGFLSNLGGLDLKTFKILTKPGYGWVEFVPTLPCETVEEVREFYKKLGMLVALMYLLDATDCHFENIIASGKDPVLIDLESIFHPYLKSSAEEMEIDIWRESVFRTTFLPSFGISAEKRMAISPLTVEEEEPFPRKIPRWSHVNTDDMQVAFVEGTMKIEVPRPYFQNKLTKTLDYLRELLWGFNKLYLYFLNHKDRILKELSPLFEWPVRCIARPTELYFLTLARLSDPRVMRSREEGEKTLQILQKYNVNESFEPIFKAEKEALLHGDIPFFLSKPKDMHIYSIQGLLAKDCFRFPVYKNVLEKIENLSHEDMERQITFIDQSLYYLKAENEAKKSTYKPLKSRLAKIPSSKEWVALAEQIGEKILKLAITNRDGSLAWITLEYNPDAERFVFQPLSFNLYSGTCGIALFFAALGKTYATHAKLILDKMIDHFLKYSEAILFSANVGGMSGIGGLIYTLTAVTNILKETKYLKAAEKLTSHITAHILTNDKAYDLISGSAGLILALLFLYQKTGNRSHLEIATQAGIHLIQMATSKNSALAWDTYDQKFLCGFAHGAAGIGFALFKLASQTQDLRFKEAALKAFLYERELYSLEMQNWPDFRFDYENNPFSWCHGAPGIGLSRLYAYKIDPLPEIKKDLDLAIASTQQHLHGYEDHLCCGNFGRARILFQCGKLLEKKELKEIALIEMAQLLERFSEKGTFQFYFSLPETVQNPGFMRGLAGIGYLCLQMSQKDRFDLPEVLILS